MFQMLCCKSKIIDIVQHFYYCCLLLLCRCSLPSANTSPFCSSFYRPPAVNALNCACPARLVARKLLIHHTLNKLGVEEWQSGQRHKKELSGTSYLNMLELLNCWIDLCLPRKMVEQSVLIPAFIAFIGVHIVCCFVAIAIQSWTNNCPIFDGQAEKAYLYELMEILIFYAWLDIEFMYTNWGRNFFYVKSLNFKFFKNISI